MMHSQMGPRTRFSFQYQLALLLALGRPGPAAFGKVQRYVLSSTQAHAVGERGRCYLFPPSVLPSLPCAQYTPAGTCAPLSGAL